MYASFLIGYFSLGIFFQQPLSRRNAYREVRETDTVLPTDSSLSVLSVKEQRVYRVLGSSNPFVWPGWEGIS